ncbi:unnamed protein product [Orchesella dallaii]|uniref:Mitochondrial cardiolipin hydrolase n=1 Tax=Orchesella dallaii TaxID=48710 RepID=A0ABP1QZS8_9HEXA
MVPKTTFSTEIGSCILFTASSIAVAYVLKKLKQYVQSREILGNSKSNATAQEDTEEERKNLIELMERRKPSALWNTAMFFPDFSASEKDSTTQQFLWYFGQATTSIRICIYNFSFPELEQVLSEQYERGLIVQFIVGHESTAAKLRLKCLPCGTLPKDPTLPATDKLMHHKFAIIDDEAVLTGSMNWTIEGILSNKENICVSTNPKHVQRYLEEFSHLLGICETAKTFY